MQRLTVLKTLAQHRKVRTYLEIGVDTGEIFYQIDAPLKIAVDPMFKFTLRNKLRNRFRLKNCLFFELTSDAFFAQQQSLLKDHPIDLAFVDGLHTWQQCLKDIDNCLAHLNTGGYIVVHDCNPPNAACETPVTQSQQEVSDRAEAGNIPGWTGNWTGDVWKAIACLRATRDDLHIFTLDADWGIGIIRRGTPESRISFSISEITQADYRFFAQNRYALLNLKPSHYFFEFLEQQQA